MMPWNLQSDSPGLMNRRLLHSRLVRMPRAFRLPGALTRQPIWVEALRHGFVRQAWTGAHSKLHRTRRFSAPRPTPPAHPSPADVTALCLRPILQ